MRPRTLLHLAIGLGVAAVAVLVVVSVVPQPPSAGSAAATKSPEQLAQELLNQELNKTLAVSTEDIEKLLLQVR